MNCYWCENLPGPGGTRLRPITASAVCQACGAALCQAHGHRSAAQMIVCIHCPAAAVAQNSVNPGAHL